MPQHQTFRSGNLYSHFRSEHAVPDIPAKVSDAAILAVPKNANGDQKAAA